MKLIYTLPHGKNIKVGQEVKVGDKALTFRGEPVTVEYFVPPHKSGSSGKVTVKDTEGNMREYFVGVIDAEWIDREDRN